MSNKNLIFYLYVQKNGYMYKQDNLKETILSKITKTIIVISGREKRIKWFYKGIIYDVGKTKSEA